MKKMHLVKIIIPNSYHLCHYIITFILQTSSPTISSFHPRFHHFSLCYVRILCVGKGCHTFLIVHPFAFFNYNNAKGKKTPLCTRCLFLYVLLNVVLIIELDYGTMELWNYALWTMELWNYLSLTLKSCNSSFLPLRPCLPIRFRS